MRRSFISLLKDAALEKAALRFLQPKVERYGEIIQLGINTKTRHLSAEIQLNGEPGSVKILRASYRIEGQGDETRLVLYHVKVSREWLQKVLDDHVPEIKVPIPAGLRLLLRI